MADSSKLRDFVQLLWGDLKCAGLCRATSWEDYARFTLDCSQLRLALGDRVPLILAEKWTGELTAGAYLQFREDVNRMATKTGLFCLGVSGARIPDRLRQPLGDDPADDYAVLDEDVIALYSSEPDPGARLILLTRELVKQVGVLKLSPYSLDVPATGGRFFGREAILKKLLASKDKSFTIVGPRRIGKTSLLRQVKRWLEKKHPEPDTLRTAWVTCTKYNDSSDAISDILKAFYRSGSEREALRLDLRKARIHSFPSLIGRMARGSKRVAVFVDEVDYIVEMDEKQGYECLSLLKSAFDHENCQIFFAGFRSASRARLDNRTPLFGFTQFEELKPLSMSESRDMIRRPFHSLGIDLVDLVVEQIAQESAGHPQVITMFCDTILNLYNTNGLMPTDVELRRDVFTSREFQQKVMDTFTMNTNAFEELVCLLLMREALKNSDGVGRFEFGLERLNYLLERAGIELETRGIVTICNNLRLCSILTPTERRNMFVFSIPQLVHFFSGYNLDWYIEKAARTLRNSGTNWRAIYSEADVTVADRLFLASTARHE